MPESPSPTVVLVGPPAAGKTKVGKELAKKLAMPFIDTDRMIEAEHGPIPQIFAQYGEQEFRRLERDAIRHALHSDGVVSLGGGAVTVEDNRRDLRGFPVVLLWISDDAVSPRLNNPKRPLLATGGLPAWKALVDARTPWYREVATHTVDVSHRSVDDVAEDIRGWLESKELTP